MSEWTDLVTKIYHQNKSKPGYKFKNAMKDAAKVYKKGSASASVGSTKKKRKSRRKSGGKSKKRR
jgi:hypothetical protein